MFKRKNTKRRKRREKTSSAATVNRSKRNPINLNFSYAIFADMIPSSFVLWICVFFSSLLYFHFWFSCIFLLRLPVLMWNFFSVILLLQYKVIIVQFEVEIHTIYSYYMNAPKTNASVSF